ncbi:MAG: cyclase [Thermoplasmata archaeon]|nr:cyclase [Thermoplasmata archaeon]
MGRSVFEVEKMAYLLVSHHVEDFAKWKPVYDAYQLEPSNPRSKGDLVFQSPEDPNEVTVLSEFESWEDAEAFMNSEELKDAMQHAGVSSEPVFTYLERV